MSLDLAGIFVAGLLTFASPCILPLVPLYLGLLGGASAHELRHGVRPRVVSRAAAFALGLATVFVALGLVASAAGRLLAAHRQGLLAVSGVAIVALGLRSLGVLRLPLLDRERRPWLHRLAPGGSLLAAYAFGAAFALGWTPCIGPVLGAVLTYTASAGADPARGALDLAVYASGLALPMVGAAAFAPWALRLLERARPHLRKLELATGALLVVVGALLATDRLMVLMPDGGARGAPEPTAAAAAPALPAAAPAAPCPSAASAAAACAMPPAAWSAPPPGALPASAVPGPAVVELMSHSCPVCRLMAPVVVDAERGCPSKVVRAFVEEPRGADLARRHAVRGVPTFLVLDASGAEVERLVGQQPAAAVRRALELVSPGACDPAHREARGS